MSKNPPPISSSLELAITDDLNPVLSILTSEDANSLMEMKEELTDNWKKKQIFRTETEMRISVLNDGKHPTKASKYWQSVREMSAHFDALVALSFDIRRNKVQRLKLERKFQKAFEKGDELKQMEIQIDLDENLVNRAYHEQVAKDRVREITSWSKIKSELDDGSFDSQQVNTHQAHSYYLQLQNRANNLHEKSDPTEIINALGPLKTIERLTDENFTLKPFSSTPKFMLKKPDKNS